MSERAILYARFSPRKNSQDCDSIDRQLVVMREYCDEHGIEVMGEFSDEALSGADYDRPGLWDSVAALKRGWILIVRDYQRLARDATLAMVIEQKIKQRGCSLMATENGDLVTRDEDPSTKMMRTIMHAFAEFDRAVRNARTRAGMLRNQRNGRRQSSIPPYGWRSDADSELNEYGRPSGMLHDAAEQVAIDRMRELREAGASYRSICETLKTEGHPPRANEWHPATVLRILKRK
jgi:DNA invertase Pin-like site-specific DNA recombinase